MCAVFLTRTERIEPRERYHRQRRKVMNTMSKTLFQVLLMLALPSGLVFGQPAEQATAASNATTLVASHVAPNPPVITAFTNAITATIKPPAGQSDLLVTFSAFTVLVAQSANVDQSTA